MFSVRRLLGSISTLPLHGKFVSRSLAASFSGKGDGFRECYQGIVDFPWEWPERNNITAALFEAVKSGDVVQVNKAIADGANLFAIDYEQNFCFEYAIIEKQIASLELLLTAAKPQAEYLKALLPRWLVMAAAQSYEATELLLKAGASPNANFKDHTPLMMAIKKGDVRTIKLLLNAGADAGLISPIDGSSLLHMAVKLNDIELVKLCLSKGLDVNAKNDIGLTPIYAAIYRGNKDMLDLLIAHGAKVNVQDSLHGESPLHVAVQVASRNKEAAPEHLAVIKCLIDHKANVGATNHYGITPAAYALTNDSLLAFMQAHGAVKKLPSLIEMFNADRGRQKNSESYMQRKMASQIKEARIFDKQDKSAPASAKPDLK